MSVDSSIALQRRHLKIVSGLRECRFVGTGQKRPTSWTCRSYVSVDSSRQTYFFPIHWKSSLCAGGVNSPLAIFSRLLKSGLRECRFVEDVAIATSISQVGST